MSVSSALVIIKGIEFGDEIVAKWLTSLIVSFLSSVLLTQPLKVIINMKYIILTYILTKVILVMLFCSLIVRKSSDDEINDEDYDLTRNLKLRSDETWLYGVPVSVSSVYK
jgi:hypothetical protein